MIFDSRVAIGTGQAVYMAAVAAQLAGVDLERFMDVFSRRSLLHGGSVWTPDDVQPPAHLRLYRAVASSHFVLGPRDERVPVHPRREGQRSP